MNDKQNWVCVAAISGAFGVAGEIKLKSFTQNPESCVLYGPLYTEEGALLLTPLSHRVMTNHIALKTRDVQDRESAQALKGIRLYVPREALPDHEDEDEFYYSDLIGLEVKTTTGQRAGKIIAVHEFGAGDMLEIKSNAKMGESSVSFYHPFTKQSVPKVDIKSGRVIIHIIEAENGRGPHSAEAEIAATEGLVDENIDVGTNIGSPETLGSSGEI